MGKLNYLNDDDLNFLSRCENDELEPLVKLLTEDSNNSLRNTQELTKQPEYLRHFPSHNSYWYLIAAELQYFGGNSIMNTTRGHGVLYDEILIDVCKAMKLSGNTLEEREQALLEKVLSDIVSKLSPEETFELLKGLDLPTDNINSQVAFAAIIAAIRGGGFYSYQLALIIANSIARAIIGKGLTFATNATIARTIAMLSGPIGIALTAAWTIIDIAGPAYRVTVPATIYVSLLRKIKTMVFCKGCNHVLTPSAKFCPECGKAVDQPIAVRT